jgi:hypothetical protein
VILQHKEECGSPARVKHPIAAIRGGNSSFISIIGRNEGFRMRENNCNFGFEQRRSLA